VGIWRSSHIYVIVETADTREEDDDKLNNYWRVGLKPVSIQQIKEKGDRK